MPPITLHMVLAERIAGSLGHPLLDSARGPYLLGATTPDIRVITRQDRRSTHFFDLSQTAHQDSVETFLETHPALRDPGAVSSETASFLGGYVSHLVMDEQYILNVYRTHFLELARTGGTMRANVMDRLLQFDLEREHAADPELRARIIEALGATIEGVDIGFIDRETLLRWQVVTQEIAARGMDWDRARAMIANHLRFSGLEEGETMSTFLDSLPDLLDETIAHITSAEIEGFVDRCTDAAGRAVERYLGCA